MGFEDGSVITASCVGRCPSHTCTTYAFFTFPLGYLRCHSWIFSWPCRKKGRLDGVDRYPFRTFFFAEPLITSTDNHLSISVCLMAPSLPIYQGWAAKSALCVEMSWINRKLSQDFWMDGQTIRALYSYRLFWRSLLRPRLPQCVRACK